MSVDLSDCVDFLQRLLRTPSPSGGEGAVADLVEREMTRLGYQDVRRDEVGNVIGVIRGTGDAPPMMFNTHLDHVDAGDPSTWPHPPFSGALVDGYVWGRGAVDIKGPLAAQIHGVARVMAGGGKPAGDVYVTTVVQEEVGGLGARHLVTHLTPPFVVVGEPSGNQLRRGHRGRTEAVLHVVGRSAHASVPHLAINPLEVIATFIGRLKTIGMRAHDALGASTVAPTLIRTDQVSPNVIPSEAWLTCDWRNVPGETAEDVCRVLSAIARVSAVDGAFVEVLLPEYVERAYTGFSRRLVSFFPPFILDRDHPAVRAAEAVLTDAIGPREPVGIWRFATDGGHFAMAGLSVIGFGPGDEQLAHTNREAIALDDLATAMAGNHALAMRWTKGL